MSVVEAATLWQSTVHSAALVASWRQKTAHRCFPRKKKNEKKNGSNGSLDQQQRQNCFTKLGAARIQAVLLSCDQLPPSATFKAAPLHSPFCDFRFYHHFKHQSSSLVLSAFLSVSSKYLSTSSTMTDKPSDDTKPQVDAKPDPAEQINIKVRSHPSRSISLLLSISPFIRLRNSLSPLPSSPILCFLHSLPGSRC